MCVGRIHAKSNSVGFFYPLIFVGAFSPERLVCNLMKRFDGIMQLSLDDLAEVENPALARVTL